MKRMMVAALLAVGLTAAAHERALAWCKFNMGVGANLGYESGGGSWSFGIQRSTPVAPPSGGAAMPYPVASGATPPSGYDPNAASPGGSNGPALPPGTLPTPTPKPASGPQPAAYFTQPGSGYGYAAYQPRSNPAAVPSYWYDK
jgi:hypothetical protein